MENNKTTLAEVDKVGPALFTPTEFAQSQWMMDSKYGSMNISFSANVNPSANLKDDLDFLNEILDNGLTIEPLTSEVTAMQCDQEEAFLEHLSSSSPDSWSIDHSFSSTAALSPTNFTVSSTSDSNFDLVSSSTLIDETPVRTTSDVVDIFSMLLGDSDAPLDDILERMENAAVKQTPSAKVVRLDHDYTKKNSSADDVDQPCSSASIDVDLDCESAELSSAPKKRKFAEMERRSRNNEASRRSRAIRKEKFKRMENDVQRLVADNQRMRVLLRDMESVAKRCKGQLVSSLGRNG